MMAPSITNEYVKKLLKILDVNEKPIYLKVTPEPYAKIVECFPAVDEKIKNDGGQKVLGWQIWKTEHILEAEFHAVWESKNGELKDITPKQIDISNILFLPDKTLKYDGRQKDNIRLNISNNPLVDDYIKICEIEFKFLNKGNRAFEYGEIKLSGKENQFYKLLQETKSIIFIMLQTNYTRNSYCLCGSQKKYKHCHGHKLEKKFKV